MRKRAGVVLIAVCLAACQPPPEPAEGAIVMIDDRPLTYSDFESFLERMVGSEGAALEGRVLTALFEQFLEEELLLQLAVDRRLVPRQASSRAALEALLAEEEASPPTDEEVRAYFEQNTPKSELPERVWLRQILVEDRRTAEEALVALEKGESFVDVARRLSIDPSAPFGGDQGELALADVPTVFAAAVAALEPGEVSGILEADYGFHIFQLVERLPVESLPFEAVADEIRQQLEAERLTAIQRRLVESARQSYNVRIEERNLPFLYRQDGEAPGS